MTYPVATWLAGSATRFYGDKENGSWRVISTTTTIRASAVARAGDRIMIGARRSRDGGDTWDGSVVTGNRKFATVTKRPTKAIGVSSEYSAISANWGTTQESLYTNPITLTYADHPVLDAYLDEEDILHVLGRVSGEPSAHLFYSRSEDLGKTWTTPILVLSGSTRNNATVYARGGKVAVVQCGDLTKKIVRIWNGNPLYPWEFRNVSYCEVELLYNASTDNGDTWVGERSDNFVRDNYFYSINAVYSSTNYVGASGSPVAMFEQGDHLYFACFVAHGPIPEYTEHPDPDPGAQPVYRQLGIFSSANWTGAWEVSSLNDNFPAPEACGHLRAVQPRDEDSDDVWCIGTYGNILIDEVTGSEIREYKSPSTSWTTGSTIHSGYTYHDNAYVIDASTWVPYYPSRGAYAYLF